MTGGWSGSLCDPSAARSWETVPGLIGGSGGIDAGTRAIVDAPDLNLRHIRRALRLRASVAWPVGVSDGVAGGPPCTVTFCCWADCVWLVP